MTGLSRYASFALIGLLLIAGPIACGKRGSLEVPENRRSEFTYPKAYPAPQSVVPNFGAAEEEETSAVQEPVFQQRKSKVSTFPSRDDETTVYGPANSQ